MKKELLEQIDGITSLFGIVTVYGRTGKIRYATKHCKNTGEILWEDSFKEKYFLGFNKKGKLRKIKTKLYDGRIESLDKGRKLTEF